MILKALTAATAAAFLALSGATLAQTSGSGTTPGASGGSPAAVPAKCAKLTGTEREKCLQEERAGGASGGPSGSPSSPSSAPSPSGSGMPSSGSTGGTSGTSK